MATAAFDTLKFARRLKEAGIPDRQAEAEAEALAKVFDVQQEELVTRQYLDSRLERDLAPLRPGLRLIKWMLALVIVVPVLKSLLA